MRIRLGVGPRRPNLNPTILALLLRQHRRDNLRSRLCRPRQTPNIEARTSINATRRRTQKFNSRRASQQTGYGGSAYRYRDSSGAGVRSDKVSMLYFMLQFMKKSSLNPNSLFQKPNIPDIQNISAKRRRTRPSNAIPQRCVIKKKINVLVIIKHLTLFVIILSTSHHHSSNY